MTTYTHETCCVTHWKKFPVKNFLSKCYQIRMKLWILSHLLKKILNEKFHFYVQWLQTTVFTGKAEWSRHKLRFIFCVLFGLYAELRFD